MGGSRPGRLRALQGQLMTGATIISLGFYALLGWIMWLAFRDDD